MRRLHEMLVGWLLLILAALPSPLSAQDGEPAGYREAVEQALSEYGAKNYEEASTLFAQAHALFPNARTLRGLGMAAFELRRYVESADALERALRSEVRPLAGELREQTEQLLARARGFVAVLRVELEPRSATLTLDGQHARAREDLRLPLGEHVLVAAAEGYRTEQRNLRVRGGEVLRLPISLDRELLSAAPVERPRPLYKRPWLWTSVGLVVAGGVVAGVLFAMRDGDTRVVPRGEAPNGWLDSRGAL